MRDEVRRDLHEAAVAFDTLIAGELRHMLGGGQLMSTEQASAELGFCDVLDTAAGIDAWHCCSRGIRGIAVRVQRDGRDWQTFTIRYSRASGAETEFSKRLRAIDEAERGWMLPHLTLQAYVTGDGLVLRSFAVVLTRALLELARSAVATGITTDAQEPVYLQTNHRDGNTFLVVKWTALQRKGPRVFRRWVPIRRAA